DLARFIDETAGAGTRSRAAVDTSALLERDLAARAGLGWIGKNTNLIAPDLGSYVFIGIVLTTAELPPDAPHADRCGSCRACLDACPTGAFVEPYVLDARRCISYLTIEHRGPVPAAQRATIGEWLFGCDVCQEVCPWNRRAPAAGDAALGEPSPAPEPADLLGLDEAAFRARYRRTALWRARRSGLLRNAALVMANRGERSAIAALEQAAGDADPTVREAAAWALERLRESGP
ncbi:MAG: tRNA epoxyqueuosine(34) reductase QueG, partial [Candidatus Rokubacteria bacterium]|nr:tRNA epoxyqueuosine(34) reductase QueG [Candidatus Rokubacteria bacterium]